MVNFDTEELNQYYLAAEIADDFEANTMKMRASLNSNARRCNSFKNYLPQDNYLTDLTEELKQALSSCIQHHQMLIEFSVMMENFFSLFVLLKSFQSTFQICNLVFTFIKVRSPLLPCLEISSKLFPNILIQTLVRRLKRRWTSISICLPTWYWRFWMCSNCVISAKHWSNNLLTLETLCCGARGTCVVVHSGGYCQ